MRAHHLVHRGIVHGALLRDVPQPDLPLDGAAQEQAVVQRVRHHRRDEIRMPAGMFALLFSFNTL